MKIKQHIYNNSGNGRMVETFKETGKSKEIYEIIMKEIKLITKEEITKRKDAIEREILDKKGEETSLRRITIENTNFTVYVDKEFHGDFNKVINVIKEEYIQDEAIMLLVREGKLIPTGIGRDYKYANGSNILIEIINGNGNENFYVYLDSIIYSKFKITLVW